MAPDDCYGNYYAVHVPRDYSTLNAVTTVGCGQKKSITQRIIILSEYEYEDSY